MKLSGLVCAMVTKPANLERFSAVSKLLKTLKRRFWVCMILGHKWGGRRSGKEVFLLVEVVFWGGMFAEVLLNIAY